MSKVRERCGELAKLTDKLVKHLLERSPDQYKTPVVEALSVAHTALEVERTRLELIEEDEAEPEGAGFRAKK
jgi:hypothetical protein